MVLRAAHPRRIFLQHPQARYRLAGVEQDAAGPLDPPDIIIGHGRDTGKMLHRVERAALRGQHRPALALQPHDIGAGRNRLTFSHKDFNLHIRVQIAEKGFRNRQPGDHRINAAVHDTGEYGIGRNDRLGGHILPPFTKRPAKIFGERGLQKGGKIEAVQGKGQITYPLCARSVGPKSPCPTVALAISIIRSIDLRACKRRFSSISMRGSRSRRAT